MDTYGINWSYYQSIRIIPMRCFHEHLWHWLIKILINYTYVFMKTMALIDQNINQLCLYLWEVSTTAWPFAWIPWKINKILNVTLNTCSIKGLYTWLQLTVNLKRGISDSTKGYHIHPWLDKVISHLSLIR